ncbi:MAG: histidine kinase [Bacillota bacterium]|nr:histidine kinase [Bacillota bacterium]
MTTFRAHMFTVAVLLSAVELAAVASLRLPQGWLLGLFLLGCNAAAFALLDRSRSHVQKRAAAQSQEYQQIDRTLQIASETLPYLRRGLTPETALKIAQIIQKISDVAAVAITDRERVLAFIGAGCDKHRPGDEILTAATKEALARGEMKIVKNQRQLNCPRQNCDCPLAAAVIVPLFCRDQVVGALKLYETHDGELPPYIIKLASGLAQLLGMQIELAELDQQAQLVCRAELDALRAQINPHFLFNTLNTIIMYSRTDPQKTRRLLIRLADFFRQTLRRSGHFHSFREELEFVRTYLYLEKARFKEKLSVRYRIDPRVYQVEVPVLTVQPLVENAVKHGIGRKVEPGTVEVAARLSGRYLEIVVRDDGVGIPPEKLSRILQPGFASGNGVGLNNVWERLKRLYGEDSLLQVESTPGSGTTVLIRIPAARAAGEGAATDDIAQAQGFDR